MNPHSTNSQQPDARMATIAANKRGNSPRRIFARLLTVLGSTILLSALIVNPWAGKYYRQTIINYQDVMLTYCIWAIAIGLLIIVNGFVLRLVKSDAITNVSITLVIMALFLLSDRLLLTKFGMPLWIADLDNHYKHRPNAIRLWGSSYNDRLIKINSYGHHDDDFPLKKGDGEFRGLMLGDSVTMGHGVTRDETFANQLETLLTSQGRRPTQIINAGVQGYSTFQEYNTFLNSLAFEPDFVAVGFCMNDPIEPFAVDKRLGGLGLDYHGITQASSALASYLLNETGYGRLVQDRRSRRNSVELAKRWERLSVNELSQKPLDDPKFSENWRMVLTDLDRIYAAAKERKIRILLLIFPYTFQLADSKSHQPQHILTEHAQSRGVDVIDFTDVFRKLIFDEYMVRFLVEKGFSQNEIDALHTERIHRYFLDDSHLTVEGHKIAASILYHYVSQHYSF